MPLTLADLEYLTGPDARELLAGDLPDDPLAARRRLRGRCTPAQGRAIVALRSLRSRAAAAKFPPDWAERLLLTDALLQQASSLRVAAYKGRRLRAWAGEGPLLDLCCGLGADALGAAALGQAVRGYDRSAVAVFCARHNARVLDLSQHCRFEQADVTVLELPATGVVHVDPDRRAGGRRAIAWDHYSPPAAFLRGLPDRTLAGCLKLSPAMDAAALAGWPGVALEYVSEGGVCRQLLAWWPGEASAGVARPPTRATVLAGDFVQPQATSIDATAEPAPCRQEFGPYVVEPNPAVIAAGAADALAAAHGLWRAAPRLAWLFGSEPVRTPLGRCFRVRQVVPGREADVAAALRACGAGPVEVKPRGLRLDTDGLQRRLAGTGPNRLAVLWTRIGRRQRALVAEPVD